MRNFDWHTDFGNEPATYMFIRIMLIVGLATLVLAFILLVHASRTGTSPFSDKPLGTSTLGHGGPPVAPPSEGLPDRPGDGARDQDRLGDAK